MYLFRLLLSLFWSIRRLARFWSKRRSALRALAALLLTLYIGNKSSAQEISGGELTVEALFDFEVPVSVISNGLVDALGYDAPDSWTIETDDTEALSNLISDMNSTLPATNAPFAFGGENFLVPDAITNTYSEAILDLASSTNFTIGDGPDSGFLGNLRLDNFGTIESLMGQDSPVSLDMGLHSPVASAVPTAFFITSLSVDILKDIDGGRISSMVAAIDEDSWMGWLPRGYEPSLRAFCDLVNQSWISTCIRGVAKVACILLFWILAYRFVLQKLFLIIDASLNTVRKAKLGE